MLRSPASRRTALLALAFVAAVRLPAQAKPAREEPESAASSGMVTGHVYLAGSNLPARFAQVGLQPIRVTKPAQPIPGRGTPLDFKVYETDLDGAFTISHVTPGTYYVVVKEPGCLSPFSQFSESDLEHPSDAIARQMAETIPTVSVRPSSTASIVIQLQRGATLRGTVRFDDGTAYPDASVEVERKGTDGKWDLPRATDSSTNSDQDGHWVIGGLPAGEYRVQTSLR